MCRFTYSTSRHISASPTRGGGLFIVCVCVHFSTCPLHAVLVFAHFLGVGGGAVPGWPQVPLGHGTPAWAPLTFLHLSCLRVAQRVCRDLCEVPECQKYPPRTVLGEDFDSRPVPHAPDVPMSLWTLPWLKSSEPPSKLAASFSEKMPQSLITSADAPVTPLPLGF